MSRRRRLRRGAAGGEGAGDHDRRRRRATSSSREVAPREGDILLPKKHPSAFFGTPLASYLIDLGVDTLVVTGCTTSGCVRGTVVDAFAYNFRVVVPEECVYDRSASRTR